MHRTARRFGLALSAAIMGLAVTGFTGGCASSSASRTSAAATSQDIVTEPESLRGRREAGTVILDVRSATDFTASRLVGARRVDLGRWTELSRADETDLARPEVWAVELGRLGLRGDERVIVTDDGKMTDAARAWFILQRAGMVNSSVLNGGMKAALASGLETESGSVPAPAAATFQPASRPGKATLAEKTDVQAVLGAARGPRIVDARTPEEYAGTNVMRNPRGGHLPGAVNIPVQQVLNAEGRIKSVRELQKLFEDAGVMPGEPILTYCQSGGRASLMALAALRAGFGDVRNYYMSFSEWAADASCPVALPAAR